jgi:hypothetical protein
MEVWLKDKNFMSDVHLEDKENYSAFAIQKFVFLVYCKFRVSRVSL